MNIFKTTTLTWWQVNLLEWAAFFIGIAVGATWPELFTKYVTAFVIIGLLLSLYLFKVWVKNR